jgi:hypothetical protein
MNAIDADTTCTDIEWTRIASDVNGNPRFVCHFTDLEGFTLRFHNRVSMTLDERYTRAIKAANKLGGRKYHNKGYGGGIVFQAYEHQLPELARRVRALLTAA